MASLSNDNGLRRILVCLPDGSRPAIRLGRMPLKDARRILGHVEHLMAAKFSGSAPPPETASWLADSCGDTLRDRLVVIGLAAPKVVVTQGPTLGELVEIFKDRPKWRSSKPATRTNYEFAFRHILNGLGADTPIANVTEAMAENLSGYLSEPKPSGAGLSRSTGCRFCDAAAMLFRFAVRSRLIDRNPFDGVRRTSVATTRRAFVDDATSRRMLDAMKDSQWRLLFALARWGGLRTPSEPRLLRWGDIDWENERFTVTSPKTEHYEGHGSRVVPIFPELAPLFDERYAEAEDGDELVLPFMQPLERTSFGHQFVRTAIKLGIDPWPRMCHNLRSTRQTELEQLYPTYVVCAWLGNSAAIAAKHYLQVTDEHFSKAAHNPAQHTPAQLGMTGYNKEDCTAIPRSAE